MDLAGLRIDGRRAGEMRQIQIKLGLGGNHDGSAYLEMGQTRVMAQVFGPHEVDNRRDESHEHASIVVEYVAAPFAGLERKRRRVGDRQGVELALAVKQSLEATVLVKLYPHTQIDVQLTLLQDDGGRLPACLNAATMALVDAGIGMSDMLVSCSAGFLKGGPVVDLNYREQGGGGAYLPVALLPATEEVVLAQMDSRLKLDDFEPLLDLAIKGCHQVHSVLKEAASQHAE
eukprot:CAMPEP_0172637212 /NCGR_PEP_ID=MMETSP1068-20121228/207838_1 /TAXON_ID=35684 /ORGANISM="Pseudopedinella elastica, Strain CCMP716" /LENGTH=230 /DNA_ID=CAMNT_0013449803 /DNA_START=5 /DNA_END=694 /DNA_ORIENTATION=+